MSHYVVGRLYRDQVVGAHLDFETIRVRLSNLAPTPVHGTLDVVHLHTDGSIVNRWVKHLEVGADTNIEAIALEGYYAQVVDRNQETIFSRFLVDEVPATDDLLLLCPIAELTTPNSQLSVVAAIVADGRWQLAISTNGVSKMVQIEGTDGLILSDNYFPLVVGYPRTITIRTLEKDPREQITLTVSSLDGPDSATQTVDLPRAH